MQGTAETCGLDTSSTIREALSAGASAILRDTGSDEGSLEAELLMCHALGTTREQLYQRLSDTLGEGLGVYEKLIQRRCAHEPTAYILGRREFFGLELEVTPAALIPRPETEALLELVIRFARERFGGEPFTLVDVGVGCGTIAVAVAHSAPNARVVATDLSGEALALAWRNAERHGVTNRIQFRRGDLLVPLAEPVDVIAANLPYVTTADWDALPVEIRDWEPRSALDGGPDGLRVIERFLREAPRYLRPGGALFAEVGDAQGGAASAIARAAFPGAAIEVKQDLAGRDRVLCVIS